MKAAKIFQKGQSQAVRLPKEFRFASNEVFIKRMGSAVVLMPGHDPWKPLIESLGKCSSDFMEERNQPLQQQREVLFK